MGNEPPGSTGAEEAQARAAALLGGQVRQPAYTLTYADGFIAIAWVCLGSIVLIAVMKQTKIYFDVQLNEWIISKVTPRFSLLFSFRSASYRTGK